MKNELEAKIVNFLKTKTRHRYCADGFYSCPKDESYFGFYAGVPVERRPCDCDADKAIQLLKEMEAS